MSPESMQFAVQKVKDSGNQNIWITDRGKQFGYEDLIVDFRVIPVMKKFTPVVLYITHSLQQPNQINGITGGRPENIEIITRAVVASGVDVVFLETHFNTSIAKSDGSNMLELEHLDRLLTRLTKLRSFIKERL